MRRQSLRMTESEASGQAAKPTPAQARAQAQTMCFRQSDIESSIQAGRSTLNLKIRDGRYFQIQTKGVCFISPGLDPYVLQVRGSDTVCHPIDIDLSGSAGGCIVDTITPLTKAQVSALPKKEQP